MTGHGGIRSGAGRPKGGRFGEATKAVRIPCSRLKDIEDLLENKKNSQYQLPLYLSKVPAGFPSPADDYIECQLDLNEHLIKHPSGVLDEKRPNFRLVNNLHNTA